MPALSVHVSTPSRLHFGMFSFGQPGVRQFGGVGAMIDRPGLRLSVSPAERFEVDGPLADRAGQFARRVFESLRLPAEPPCRVEIMAAPPEHVGLGTGTQLGLAVAAGLTRFLGQAVDDPLALAQLVGRGERSAVGTYGFAHGGLLVEAGKFEGGSSPLVSRVELPTDWRFVLIMPTDARGLAGEEERAAFAALPPVPLETTARLASEALMHLLPAAAEGRFDEFSESLFRFGHTAGMCFAARQGGAFASEELTALVEQIRSLGVRGVGQSSWGPTLFALLPNQQAAEDFQQRLRASIPTTDLTLTITPPNDSGALIELG